MTRKILVFMISLTTCLPRSATNAPDVSFDDAQPWLTAELDLELAKQELIRRFEERLDVPHAFEAAVRQTRRQFPEGDLFSYTFPASSHFFGVRGVDSDLWGVEQPSRFP